MFVDLGIPLKVERNHRNTALISTLKETTLARQVSMPDDEFDEIEVIYAEFSASQKQTYDFLVNSLHVSISSNFLQAEPNVPNMEMEALKEFFMTTDGPNWVFPDWMSPRNLWNFTGIINILSNCNVSIKTLYYYRFISHLSAIVIFILVSVICISFPTFLHLFSIILYAFLLSIPLINPGVRCHYCFVLLTYCLLLPYCSQLTTHIFCTYSLHKIFCIYSLHNRPA